MHVTHKIIHLIQRVCHEFKLEFNRELGIENLGDTMDGRIEKNKTGEK